MIKLNNISKSYKDGNDKKIVLENINLKIDKGLVAITGVSGSGKSTLLNILSGLIKSNSGSYIFGKEDISKMSFKELTNFRSNNIGMIFQNYNLIKEKTVYDNLILPLYFKKISKKDYPDIVEKKLAMVNMVEYFNKKVKLLSGGEMQRIAILRAIMNDPKILLADEPTASLDTNNAVIIMDILKKLSKTMIVIIVTHDLKIAEICDDVYYIENSLIIKDFIKQ